MDETLQDILAEWNATDIMEHWDEFTTVQPVKHKTNGRELVLYITRCEMCRTKLRATFREFNHGSVVEDFPLVTHCVCDEMDYEDENTTPFFEHEENFCPREDAMYYNPLA